jgi:hypothetical protein
MRSRGVLLLLLHVLILHLHNSKVILALLVHLLLGQLGIPLAIPLSLTRRLDNVVKTR